MPACLFVPSKRKILARLAAVGLLATAAATRPVAGPACATPRGAGEARSGNSWLGMQEEILAALAAQDPVEASQRGMHAHDGQYPDFSPLAVRRDVAAFERLQAALRSFRSEGLTRDQMLDREVLARALDLKLRVLTVEKPFEKSPAFYSGLIQDGLETLLIHPYGSAELRARALDGRLRELPRMLGQARAQVRQPAPLLCRISSASLHGLHDLFVGAVLPVTDATSLRDSARTHVARAELAIEGYREFLGDQEEEGEESPSGGASFALGRENYEWRLQHVEGLALSGPELAALGRRWLAEIEGTLDSLNHASPGSPSPVQVAPPGFTRAQLLRGYAAEIDFLREFVRRKDLATIPRNIGPLVPVPTPSHLRPVIPGQAMEPPLPLDTTTVGTYYLGSSFPDSLTAANRDAFYTRLASHAFRGGALHEGFPGHHLQLSVAKHHGSRARRYSDSTVLVEGWATYCEELMAQQGLWGADRATALQHVLPGMRFRALRVIVDAELHCGTLSYDDAVAFMRAHSPRGGYGGDSAFVAGEVARYVTEPTQAMSYLVGKSLILGLKAEVRRLEGGRFSLKSFHDRLLSYGSIPVPWIARDWLGQDLAPGSIRDRWE